jgi:microcystin-dependent protein
MADEFIGTISFVAFQFAPEGWALCHGQSMDVMQNKALYSLISTTWGGDGQRTFNLPDLRGRVPMGVGDGPGLSKRNFGDKGGAESVTLTGLNLPPHGHPAKLEREVKVEVEHTVQWPLPGGGTTPTGSVTTADTYLTGGGSAANAPFRIFAPANGKNTKQAAINDVKVSVTQQPAIHVEAVGEGRPFQVMPPFTVLTPIIMLNGIYPTRP